MMIDAKPVLEKLASAWDFVSFSLRSDDTRNTVEKNDYFEEPEDTSDGLDPVVHNYTSFCGCSNCRATTNANHINYLMIEDSNENEDLFV